MPSATPAPSNWCTSWRSGAPPPAGVNTSSSLPGALISRSVARYWSPNACLRGRARRPERLLGACWASCQAPQRKARPIARSRMIPGPACVCMPARCPRCGARTPRAGLPSQVLIDNNASHAPAAAAGPAARTPLTPCSWLSAGRLSADAHCCTEFLLDRMYGNWVVGDPDRGVQGPRLPHTLHDAQLGGVPH